MNNVHSNLYKMDYTEIQKIYIYFVKFNIKHNDEIINLFKIGITTNLVKRIESLKIEFNIQSDFVLLLALEVRSFNIETQLLLHFTNKYPDLKYNFKLRDILKTECFLFNEILLVELIEIERDYKFQTNQEVIKNQELSCIKRSLINVSKLIKYNIQSQASDKDLIKIIESNSMASIKLNYIHKLHNDPKIQLWISTRFGFKIIHPSRFNYIMNKIIEELKQYNENNILKFQQLKNNLEFIINNKCYKFDSFKLLIESVQIFITKYDILSNEIKRGYITTQQHIESIKTLDDEYIFINDFYNVIKPIYNKIKILNKVNTIELINLNIINISASSINLIMKNKMENIKQIANRIFKLQNDENCTITQFADEIIKFYKIGNSDNFAKSLITINKLGKKMGKITDHTIYPFNSLNKDIYIHDELIQFKELHNIDNNDRRLYNMIYYNVNSRDITKNKIRTRTLTLIKLTKQDIQIEFFKQNNTESIFK